MKKAISFKKAFLIVILIHAGIFLGATQLSAIRAKLHREQKREQLLSKPQASDNDWPRPTNANIVVTEAVSPKPPVVAKQQQLPPQPTPTPIVAQYTKKQKMPAPSTKPIKEASKPNPTPNFVKQLAESSMAIFNSPKTPNNSNKPVTVYTKTFTTDSKQRRIAFENSQARNTSPSIKIPIDVEQIRKNIEKAKRAIQSSAPIKSVKETIVNVDGQTYKIIEETSQQATTYFVVQ